MDVTRFTLLVLAGSLVAVPVLAQPYLPLAVGNHWSYQGIGGKHEQQTITGTTMILGRDVYVKSTTESSSNSGLENYWSTEPDGDVFLHGFYRNIEAFGVVYDPPLRMVDAPLAMGKSWTTHAAIFYLPGMTPGESFDFTESVLEGAKKLTVPAGTFAAFGIGQTLAPPAARTLAGSPLALDGSVQAISAQASEWYSAGVGEVQFQADDLYQLSSYDFPTPVASTTWGKLKHWYR